MIDITHKSGTFRTAIAASRVKASGKTIQKIEDGKIPKGDVWATSRAAGIMAVKNTSAMLPFCHPINVEYTDVTFKADKAKGIIDIEATVSGIAKTGFEMEALHGVTTAALNIYDMLKPVDTSLSIEKTFLREKHGGKSDFRQTIPEDFKACVIVCSDSISAGKKMDKAGQIIVDKLISTGVKPPEYDIIPDEPDQIRELVKNKINESFDLVITTGGTGLSPRDVTPEAIRPLLEKEVSGVMEASRQYGMDRTPYAMLSRGIAGVNGNTLILTMPGSTRGARESMDALFPSLFHVYRVLRMTRHEENHKRGKGK